MKEYVEDLFKYIDIFEKNYSSFKTEAFFQTYNGIYTVFQTLREQRDKAVELDYYFLDRIREKPLSDSDLRQLTIQILITFFESEADTDGRSNQAYSHCRNQRKDKRDVTHFENQLLPLLFKEGSLKGNFRLHSFLLHEVARYINKFGKRLDVELTPEAFGALPEPMKFLELQRRRIELGTDLLKDRESLEFHLQRVDDFPKIAAKKRVYKQYLSEWGYLKKRDFWSKVKSSIGELFGKLGGAFSSSRYLRLILSQRRPAYLFYSLIIILFLVIAIGVPMFWSKYKAEKLEQFKERATQVQRGIGG